MGIGVREQHHKFFAAIARDEIDGAHALLQQAGHAFQDFIAGRMAVGIVVLLELIDIEDDERKRLIEVKTTRSLNSVIINTFTMTPNEWMTAESTRDAYFIYRVTLSDKEGIRVSILCDPVGRYKKDQISMTPRDGAIVRYNDDIAEQLDITK